MPVRSRIHSSDVSTTEESSSFVTMRSGRKPPTPVTTLRRTLDNSGGSIRGRGVRRRKGGGQPPHIPFDLGRKPALRHIGRRADGFGEVALVGAPVALQHKAVQTEQRRSGRRAHPLAEPK